MPYDKRMALRLSENLSSADEEWLHNVFVTCNVENGICINLVTRDAVRYLVLILLCQPEKN